MIEYDPDSTDDVPAGTMSIQRPVTCKNPKCKKFDDPIEADLDISFVGNRGYVYYECPWCKAESGLPFDLTEEDFALAEEDQETGSE